MCRYLGEESLRREIHEGLNVIETWNSTNGFIFFGKGGEVASNRLDDQEVSVHALHLLQRAVLGRRAKPKSPGSRIRGSSFHWPQTPVQSQLNFPDRGFPTLITSIHV